LLDRSNISAAYIAGLAKDLRLDIGGRYSMALLMFFIGYFLFELPSNYVIRRIGARWWLSFLIIAVSILSRRVPAGSLPAAIISLYRAGSANE